jgi:hypothetical protein
MTIELTDKARYDLERENITNVILALARRNRKPTDNDLMITLNIDQPTLDMLKSKLKTDKVIK